MRLALFLVLLGGVFCTNAVGACLMLRDSISTTPPHTSSYVGAATTHTGTDWATPGMVLNVPNRSQLTEVQILIFARDGEFLPEND